MIQIDIPMPKNCGECPICNEYLMCGVPCNGRGWGENDVSDYFTNGRPEWCPLKEQEAEWLEVDDKHDAFDCSNCGAMAGRKCLYCPGCGAKMKNGTRAMEGR